MSIVKVSRIAGVSIATVSRVLNNQPFVSAEKADAVRRAAESVGYTVPVRTRRKRAGNLDSGAGQRTGSFALLFPDPTAGAIKTVLSGRLSHGINEELAKRGMTFIVASLADWQRMPACIENRKVDGVIVRGTVPIEHLLPLISPLPCVTVFETPRLPSYGDQVLEDSTLIGEMAASFLLESGRRQLVCVSRDPLHPSYMARADAFMRSARYAGAEVNSVVAAAPFSELVDRVLSLTPKPTGLFVAGDDVAVISISQELKQRGIMLGRDIAFISTAYDAARVESIGPGMSYIDIEPEAIGRAAVDMLFARIRTPAVAMQRRLVMPKLVRR